MFPEGRSPSANFASDALEEARRLIFGPRVRAQLMDHPAWSGTSPAASRWT